MSRLWRFQILKSIRLLYYYSLAIDVDHAGTAYVGAGRDARGGADAMIAQWQHGNAVDLAHRLSLFDLTARLFVQLVDLVGRNDFATYYGQEHSLV
jgi:hypothetical protein